MNALLSNLKMLIRNLSKFKFEMVRRGHLFWSSRVMKKLAQQNIIVEFRCNICGSYNAGFEVDVFSREKKSCMECGSNLRARSIIDLLSKHFFDKSLVLADLPKDSSICGLGVSDWNGYADILGEKFSYINTYFHKKPLLDITNVDPQQFGKFDFVIVSDVVEHICFPVRAGFLNLKKLLKPKGILIITVPFMNCEKTWEHFPELYDYKIVKSNGTFLLENKTKDGENQQFADLVFHGGPGATLEMRVFTKQSLIKDLRSVGFLDVRCHREENLQYGIKWLVDWSYPVSVVNNS